LINTDDSWLIYKCNLLFNVVALGKVNFMSKKVSTIIITAVCFVLIATLTIIYLLKEGIISTDNLFSNNELVNTTISDDINTGKIDSNLSQSASGESDLGYPVFAVLLREGTEYALQYVDEKHKTNEYSDIYIKFNSMNISKEKGDFDICEDWEETKDESGNIINEFSYVICNVTLINKGERNFLGGVNSICLSPFGKDPEYLCELRAYNSNKTKTLIKDYCLVEFEPNKEYNFNLAYIVEDYIIERDKDKMLLYCAFMYVPDIKKALMIEK